MRRIWSAGWPPAASRGKRLGETTAARAGGPGGAAAGGPDHRPPGRDAVSGIGFGVRPLQRAGPGAVPAAAVAGMDDPRTGPSAGVPADCAGPAGDCPQLCAHRDRALHGLGRPDYRPVDHPPGPPLSRRHGYGLASAGVGTGVRDSGFRHDHRYPLRGGNGAE